MFFIFNLNSSIISSSSKTFWLIFRSEEHTSELQSQSNLVCRLLLEKKKKFLYAARRRHDNAQNPAYFFRQSNIVLHLCISPTHSLLHLHVCLDHASLLSAVHVASHS